MFLYLQQQHGRLACPHHSSLPRRDKARVRIHGPDVPDFDQDSTATPLLDMPSLRAIPARSSKLDSRPRDVRHLRLTHRRTRSFPLPPRPQAQRSLSRQARLAPPLYQPESGASLTARCEGLTQDLTLLPVSLLAAIVSDPISAARNPRTTFESARDCRKPQLLCWSFFPLGST